MTLEEAVCTIGVNGTWKIGDGTKEAGIGEVSKVKTSARKWQKWPTIPYKFSEEPISRLIKDVRLTVNAATQRNSMTL